MKGLESIEGLEFDDVLVKPVISYIQSRDDVDISVKLSDTLTLKFPLFASPMVGVTNGKFLSQLSDLGGLGFFHRFYKTSEDFYAELDLVKDKNYGISIGLNQPFRQILSEYNPKIILVDIANGYLSSLHKYCEEIANYISANNLDVLLMAGNVVTPMGIYYLKNSGCNLIRFGIGSGSNCSTRNVTGVSVPIITALLHCNKMFSIVSDSTKIVVDGGIRYSGDFVKSIVGGANLCMAGRLFAETFEAPNNGILYGMASETHQNNMNYKIKSVEGFDTEINKNKSLDKFVNEYSYGIKSAGTYLNAKNLYAMYCNGEFVLASKSSIKVL